MSKGRRGQLRGVLLFLAGLMFASGAIRITFGVAIAQANGPPAQQAETPGCVAPPTPAELIKAFADREARLAAREAALNDRLAALALADELTQRRIADLQTAEASLSATLSRASGAAENDLARLTAMYESMKPRDAALLFQTMEPAFAAGFLGRMRPEAAAAVISGMSADSAYALSALLAGRNALTPTE